MVQNYVRKTKLAQFSDNNMPEYDDYDFISGVISTRQADRVFNINNCTALTMCMKCPDILVQISSLGLQ